MPCKAKPRLAFQVENFLPYLTGKKSLVPRPRDLTYCNWATNKVIIWLRKVIMESVQARWCSSTNWEVVASGPRLVLHHKEEGVNVPIGPVPQATGNQAKWRSLKTK